MEKRLASGPARGHSCPQQRGAAGRSSTCSDRAHWPGVAAGKAYDLIRHRLIIETRPEHFLEVLRRGTVATNIFLRRMQAFALEMDWLPTMVLRRRQWPALEYKDKRAIKFDEHQRIVAIEKNPERKQFYHFAGMWAPARATSPSSKAKTSIGPTRCSVSSARRRGRR